MPSCRQPLKTSLALTREVFVRTLGFIYLVAFCSIFVQAPGLFGSDGLEPVSMYLERLRNTMQIKANNWRFAQVLSTNVNQCSHWHGPVTGPYRLLHRCLFTVFAADYHYAGILCYASPICNQDLDSRQNMF
ncbi:unnamed protein product [Ostreobium quekettii]|uniref:Uncharacterized protein n=1 Tax=Ostreobium quekettii TaxID=121088 RepID=A0A8S1J4G9_9CHLO|nr:unnamed protein product [Ostreobium quekettii]